VEVWWVGGESDSGCLFTSSFRSSNCSITNSSLKVKSQAYVETIYINDNNCYKQSFVKKSYMEQCITWSLSSWNLAISIIYNTKRLVLVTAWNNRQVAASTFNKVKVQRAKFLTIQGFLLYTSLLAFRTHLFVCYLQNFIHQHKANKWMSQKHFYCAIKLCQNFLSYMYFFHDWLNIITKSKIKHQTYELCCWLYELCPPVSTWSGVKCKSTCSLLQNRSPYRSGHHSSAFLKTEKWCNIVTHFVLWLYRK